jgi:hypothetical protein
VRRLLKYDGRAFGCAAVVVLSSLMPFLCGIWVLSRAPLVQTIALTALSVCASGVIALMEPIIGRTTPLKLLTALQRDKNSVRI